MEYRRADRVGELIQREVSCLLLEGLKDPRLGMITISHVSVSPDLRYAKIYYTVYGDKEQLESTQQGLNKATGYVRRHIGKTVRLRVTPEVSFHYDTSLEHSEKMASLFIEIENNRRALSTAKHPENEQSNIDLDSNKSNIDEEDNDLYEEDDD